jgi:hypothetical protein
VGAGVFGGCLVVSGLETAEMSSGARRVHPLLLLVATGLGLFMIFLDATIVNVALPAIQHDFSVGESGSSGWWPRTA